MRTWTNIWSIGLQTAMLAIFPISLLVAFINNPEYIHALWIGIVLLYFLYELFVYSYTKAHYLNGVLEFERSIRTYSLFPWKKNEQLVIRPDEWTELYKYSFKMTEVYYFRNDRSSAYFVTVEGMGGLYREMGKLFASRAKSSLDFPKETKKRLKKEFPERVF